MSTDFFGFWKQLDTNYGHFPHSFYFNQLTLLPGAGKTTAKHLYEAGFHSIDEVAAAPEERMLATQGVGKALVELQKAQGDDLPK